MLQALPLLSVAPLVAAALIILAIHRDRAAKYIAMAGSVLSLIIIAVVVLYYVGGTYRVSWFSLQGYSFNITTSVLPLNALLLALVGIVTPLIFLYSFGYMDTKSEQSRYYFEISLFAAAMMLFAISGNFVTMFIAWEMLGITSYLLIGFWYAKKVVPDAARKAISTIIIGDILFLAAIIVLWSAYHTLNISSLLSIAGSTVYLKVALAFILVAAFTKSAQFPFNEWLSDAMEGPTPVSAFLHSSTMVKAGVFLIAILLPLYVKAGMLMPILTIGLITAIIAVMNALSEHHIKKILAYSTMEDLALMFIALGFNAIFAAMLLFVVQTFYKALLFMSAGSIMKATGEENIYKTYNFGFKTNKLLYISTIIGVLSLAGIFPLGGFFGKLGIDTSASSMYVYIALVAIDFLSSVYIFRWLYLPSRKDSYLSSFGYRTVPRSMLAPIAILAVLVLASGLAYFMLPMYYAAMPKFSISIIDSLIETVLVLTGLGIAYILYSRGRAPHVDASSLEYKLLHNSFFINAFYVYLLKGIELLGEGFDALNDAINSVINGGAYSFILLGNALKRIENGSINTYAIAFAAGIVFLVIVFAMNLIK